MSELKLTRYRVGLMYCEAHECTRFAVWIIGPLNTQEGELVLCQQCFFGLL